MPWYALANHYPISQTLLHNETEGQKWQSHDIQSKLKDHAVYSFSRRETVDHVGQDLELP